MIVAHRPHRVRSGPTRAVARAAAGERGAVLVLALVFLTVIGTLTAFLISYAFTGTKSLAAYRIERTRRYAADSALHVAVKRLSTETGASLGNSSTPEKCAQYLIPEYTSPGNVQPVVGTGAYVTVWCSLTPNAVTDAIDVDGGQAARDVTMEVRCNTSGTAIVVGGKLACGSGSNTTVIGRARVRFEIDYNLGSARLATRAVVPKTMSWQIRS